VGENIAEHNVSCSASYSRFPPMRLLTLAAQAGRVLHRCREACYAFINQRQQGLVLLRVSRNDHSRCIGRRSWPAAFAKLWRESRRSAT